MVSKGKSHTCASRLIKGFALDCKPKGYHDHLNGDNLVLCKGKRCIQGPTHAGAQQLCCFTDMKVSLLLYDSQVELHRSHRHTHTHTQRRFFTCNPIDGPD